MINISFLPDEIQNIILQFIRIEKSYKFDIDSVYVTVEPYIFMTGGNLCINISAWFGTKNPEEYKVGSILHTINKRPYPIQLERSFSNFSKILYKNIKKFKLRNDVIDVSYGKILFGGTYAPLRKGLDSDYKLPFNKLSNVSFNYNTTDILTYIREIGIEQSEFINNEFEINEFIKLLKNKFLNNIKKSIIEFSKTTNNYIGEIKLKKIRGEQHDEFYYNKLFFNICKKKSDYQKLIEFSMLKKL